MNLTGQIVRILREVWTVDSHSAWSPEYVWLRKPVAGREDDLIIRPTAVVARSIQIQKERGL